MELSPFTGHFYGRDKIRFLRGCIRHPRQFGAVAPSGRKLATAMAREIDLGVPGIVVELGAGTGPITRALLEAGVSPENLILIERDPRLCQLLALRFKGVRVWCGDAADLPRLLQEAKIDRIKTVVSGLPLLAMTEGVRKRIIEAIFTALPANGQFLQFTYGLKEPVPKKIRMQLRVAGVRCQWVLSNLPPATVWCYRPQEGG